MTAPDESLCGMRVVKCFALTGRGVVAEVEESTSLPVGKELEATVIRPDGTRLLAAASKEFILRRQDIPRENEAFVLRDLGPDDVPVGSRLAVRNRLFNR